MSTVESAVLQLCHKETLIWNLDRCPREDSAVLLKKAVCSRGVSYAGFVNLKCSFEVHQNVSDTCNANTITTQTRLANVYQWPALFYHSHVSAEHNCVEKLDCRVLSHRCAQKELSYCLVQEPIE